MAEKSMNCVMVTLPSHQPNLASDNCNVDMSYLTLTHSTDPDPNLQVRDLQNECSIRLGVGIKGCRGKPALLERLATPVVLPEPSPEAFS